MKRKEGPNAMKELVEGCSGLVQQVPVLKAAHIIKQRTTTGIGNCRPVGAGVLGHLRNSSVMGYDIAFTPSTAHTRERCAQFLRTEILTQTFK